MKNDHRSKFSNLSNWKEEAWKNQGFNGIRTRDPRDTGAMLYQLSYEATHWERGQFIEFISPVRNEMTWSIYEIIHIFKYMNYFIYTSPREDINILLRIKDSVYFRKYLKSICSRNHSWNHQRSYKMYEFLNESV